MSRFSVLCCGVLLSVSSVLVLGLHAQTPADGTQTPTELVQPALDKVAEAGSSVDLNRWKGGNAVRGEVDANLASVQKDLQETLPPLLAGATKTPHSVVANLRVLLNLDALYSVLLRVGIAGKVDAPREEAEALDGALLALDGARRDLGNTITAAAAAQETQLAQLQAQLQQQTLAIAPQARPVPAPQPVKPAKKHIVKKKAAAQSAPATVASPSTSAK